MKLASFTLLFTLPLYAQLVLSEIMFDPEGTDSPNEFVECFNLSITDTVDLGGWKIGDLWSVDDLEDGGMGTKLPPLSYVVILEGDYDISTGIYASLIPDSVLLLKVDDNSIGNQLSLRDSLFLMDTNGNIVDRYGWEDISAPGFSLERRRLDLPSTPSNWAISLDSPGTPGFLNSVTPPEIDAAIYETSMTHTPFYPAPDQIISLLITIHNLGTEPLAGTLEIVENNETLVSDFFEQLGESDSITLQLEFSLFISGIHTLEITVDVTGDVNPANNSAYYQITVRFTEQVLTLNEFHYAPDPGIPEFIELVNLSAGPLDLKNWKISDSDTGTVRILPPGIVPPAGYAVVSDDSSLLSFLPLDGILLVPETGFPSLNNSGDAIYLFEPGGTLMDSLIYTPGWGGESGRSVEKLNPALESSVKSNWGTCVTIEKMTPGAQNSIFFESLPSSGSIQLQSNPFSPDGDGYEDVLRISYNLPFTQAYLTVLIFNIEGRTVRTLAKNLATASKGVISWNGFSDRNKRARIGIYIIKISAVDRDSKRSTEWVKTAVLAEPLR